MATITVPKYDSKTGAGSLSYYARQYGTSVDELAKINKLDNPDLIQEGMALTVPDPGVQQTTTQYRRETQENVAGFDQMNGQLELERQAAAVAGAETTPEGEVTPDKGAAAQSAYSDFSALDESTKTLEKAARKEMKEIERTYKSAQKFADQAHQQLLNSIRTLYGARIDKMKDSNERLLQTKNVTNIRQGRTRYTPELAAGILTDEEMEGNYRIGELEGQMLSLLASATAAKQKNDMEAFNNQYAKLKDTQDNLNAQIKANFDMAVEKDREIRAREKEEREAAKAVFDQAVSRAESAAPALVERMRQFDTPEERTAFLEAYAERTGVEADILAGSVAQAMEDADYKALQMDNIENQIYNRNRSTQATVDREARLGEEDEEEGGILPETKNVIAGGTTIDDIPDSQRQGVIADLRDLGFYADVPPGWYVEMKTDEGITDEGQIKSAWEEYRTTIVGGV